MRIIHITSYIQPQLGYEEFYVPKIQISRGHDVFVISSDRYSPFPHYNSIYSRILGSRFSPEIGLHYEKGIPIIRLPIWLELDSSLLLKQLRKTLKALKPDIIHVHGLFYPLSLQVLLSSPSSSKIIIDAHMIPRFAHTSKINSIILFLFKSAYLKLFHRLIFFLYTQKKIRALYSTKKQVANYIEDKYKTKTSIIPLGVDTNLFDHNKYNSAEFRRNMGYDHDDFILFYSGKLIKKKGLLSLIKIYNLLRKEGGKFALLIIGNGPKQYVEFLKRKINVHYRDNVKIIPFVNHYELPKYMSVGDLGCWLGEIPSASINEFIGMGKPVLIKVFEGKNLSGSNYRFIQQYKSVKDSINWFRTLTEDMNMYHDLCRKARDFAEKTLDWRVTTNKILKLYDS